MGVALRRPTVVALGGAGSRRSSPPNGLVSLCAGLTGVCLASGSADVAKNPVGDRAEQRSGRPIITRVGAVFSTTVVVSSLATGAAFALRAPTWVPFAAVSYLGFLLGPVYMGLWASATGLRGAMLVVAALGLALATLTLPLLAPSRHAATTRPVAVGPVDYDAELTRYGRHQAACRTCWMRLKRP